MKAGFLCIGSELLAGRTTNSNFVAGARRLSELGYRVITEMTVDDDHDAITMALNSIQKQVDLVVIIGGLGPTQDDITRDVVAAYLGRKLCVDPRLEEAIKQRLERLSEPVSAASLRPARIIENAEILPNENGTAVGMLIRETANTPAMALLPGPPHEFNPMFEMALMPRVKRLWVSDMAWLTATVIGMRELDVEKELKPYMLGFPSANVSICQSATIVEIRVGVDRALFSDMNVKFEGFIRKLEPKAYRGGKADFIHQLAALLRKRRHTIALAESCTGGLMASEIVAHAGASEFFLGSAVCYSDIWKRHNLGVREDSLTRFGAVSQQVAHEMALGLNRFYGAYCGIAITGLAGPGGGSAEKPIGTVYIATMVGDDVTVRDYHFSGNRHTVQRFAVSSAFTQMFYHLHGLLEA